MNPTEKIKCALLKERENEWKNSLCADIGFFT